MRRFVSLMMACILFMPLRTEAASVVCLEAQKASISVDSGFLECFVETPELIEEKYSVFEVERQELNEVALAKYVDVEDSKERGEDVDLDISGSIITYAPKGTNEKNIFSNKSTLKVLEVRGTRKTSSGSANGHGVTLTGYIVWIDNAGMNNQVESIGGTRSGSYIGSGYYNCTATQSNGVASGTFSSSFSRNVSGTGMQIHLTIYTYASDNKRVNLSIGNSIFD